MNQPPENINTDQSNQKGCLSAALLIGGSFAVMIIVLFIVKLLFGLN